MTKEWYSPDDLPKNIDPSKCQVRSPQEGFDAAMTQMRRSMDEIQQKARRVIKYYEK